MASLDQRAGVLLGFAGILVGVILRGPADLNLLNIVAIGAAALAALTAGLSVWPRVKGWRKGVRQREEARAQPSAANPHHPRRAREEVGHRLGQPTGSPRPLTLTRGPCERGVRARAAAHDGCVVSACGRGRRVVQRRAGLAVAGGASHRGTGRLSPTPSGPGPGGFPPWRTPATRVARWRRRPPCQPR